MCFSTEQEEFIPAELRALPARPAGMLSTAAPPLLWGGRSVGFSDCSAQTEGGCDTAGRRGQTGKEKGWAQRGAAGCEIRQLDACDTRKKDCQRLRAPKSNFSFIILNNNISLIILNNKHEWVKIKIFSFNALRPSKDKYNYNNVHFLRY